MKKLKKVFRLLGLVILILLALCGISITGPFLPANHGRFLDNEIKTEQVDKKSEDEDQTIR